MNFYKKYKIETITSIEELKKYKPLWDEPHADIDNICLTYEWIECWLECFLEADSSIKIMILKENEKPITIAPFILKKSRFCLIPIKKLVFISMTDYADSPTNLCPELDFIKLNTVNSNIDYILEELKKENWNYIQLHPLSIESSSIEYIKSFAKKYNYPLIEKEAFKSFVINTATNWEDYQKSVSKRFRKQLRYYHNKLNDAGKLNYCLFKSQKEIEDNLKYILDIEKRSWKWNKGVSINSISYKNFFQIFPLKVSHLESIHLWMLSINNQYIAYDMNICYKNKVINWKGSYDERYADLGPGQLLLEKELEYYIKNGVTEFNMLWGRTLAKERWNPILKSYTEIFIFKNDLYSKFLKFLMMDLNLFLLRRIIINYKNRLLRKLKIRVKNSELTRTDQLYIKNDYKSN